MASLVLVLAVFVCLAPVASAGAAESIYWVDFAKSALFRANLSGGAVEIPISPAAMTDPLGIALDPAAGRVYWTNSNANTIGSANLDGTGAGLLDTTGATVSNPTGLTIDARAGLIYWANGGNDTISFARLSGGGGGQLDVTGAPIEGPVGISVHPGAGKIYWINDGETPSTIGFTGLKGGGGRLDTGGAPISDAESIAIDASSNRIYWTNGDTGTIGFADLGGGAGSGLDTGNPAIEAPGGLAIDPPDNRLYWLAHTKAIEHANLSGAPLNGMLDLTGVTPDEPTFPALLKAPRAMPAAGPAKGVRADRTFSCPVAWEGDLPESSLYRAPQVIAYQWLRNGRPVAGATAQTVKARRVGRYSCRAAATNFAGSATESSGEIEVKAALRLGRARLDRETGTATLAVAAAGVGKLRLAGAGIKRRVARAGAKARLRIQATGRAKKQLGVTGRMRVRARVTLLPAGGKPLHRSKTIVLRKAGLSRR